MVTSLPAAGTFRVFDLWVILVVGGEHDRKLDRVFRVHLAAVDEGYRHVFTVFPLELHVEIIRVVGGLDVDHDAAAFVRDRAWLGLFAADNQVADIDFLFLVAVIAAVAGDEGALTAVIAAFQHPFHRCLAGVEHRNGIGLDRRPVYAAVACGWRGSRSLILGVCLRDLGYGFTGLSGCGGLRCWFGSRFGTGLGFVCCSGCHRDLGCCAGAIDECLPLGRNLALVFFARLFHRHQFVLG